MSSASDNREILLKIQAPFRVFGRLFYRFFFVRDASIVVIRAFVVVNQILRAFQY